MRHLIESLDEALTIPFAVLGKHPEKPLEISPVVTDPAEDEDEESEPVNEAVSASMIVRMADAMLSAPQLSQYIQKVLRGSNVPEDALRQAIGAHIRGVLPLALSDAGANIQKALAGRSRRQAKAIGQGKSAMEAEEIEDAEFEESELSADLDTELDRE